MRLPTFRNLCVGALLLFPALTSARITAPSPSDRDAFCAGAVSVESCIDKYGDVIPTTDNTESLGTSALRWSNIYGGSFFGNGSNLTGISSSGSIVGVYVQKTGDTMSGPLVVYSSFSVQTSTFVVNGGRVGIGTASPQYALDVVGTVNASTFSVTGGTQPSLSIFSQGSNGPSVVSSTGGVLFYGQSSIGNLARFIHTNTDTLPNSFEMNINGNASAGQFSTFFFSTGTPGVSVNGQRIGLLFSHQSGDLLIGRFQNGSGKLAIRSDGQTDLESIGGGNLNITSPGTGNINIRNTGTGTTSVSGSMTLVLSSFTATGTNAQTIGIQRVNAVGATSEPGVFEIRAPNGSSVNTVWGDIVQVVGTATSGSEDSAWELRSQNAGALATDMHIGSKVGIGTVVPGSLLDISGGSVTIRGTNAALGVVGSSVNASSFFGDGSHLTGIGFSSTTYAVAHSSGFVDPATASTSYVAVSGSSITITNTTAGNRICVSGSLSWFNDTVAAHNFAQLILDGSVVQVVCYTRNTAASYQLMCPISAWTSTLASGGTHTLSLMVKVDGGIMNFDSSAKSTLLAQECAP